MRRRPRRSWTLTILLWLAVSPLLLGSTCSEDLSDSLSDALINFVGETAGDVLRILFPVADWVEANQ